MAERNPNARVTAAQVMEIVDTTKTELQVNVMINTAHLQVEQLLTGKGLSEDVLKSIELWMSAHYVSIIDPRKKQIKIDDVSVTFQGEVGQGLAGSMYGQQAMAFDTTGTLASGGLKKAVIRLE
jgi:hypothetical protein